MTDIVIKLVYNVGIMFVMMLPGFIMKKCRLAPEGFGKGLSNLVLYVAQPTLIFLAYVRPYDSSALKNILFVLLFSIVAHFIFAVVALRFFGKSPEGRQRMLRFATVFSNAAFMGIPLIGAVLGDMATIYASIYNITFNLCLWSFGVYLCTTGRDEDGDGDIDTEAERRANHPLMGTLKKAIFHPVTIAAVIGLFFFFLPIDHFITGVGFAPKTAAAYITGFVFESLTMLKNLVVPISMMVIGLRLADIDFRGIFKDKDMYIFLALRHFALPAAVFAVMRLVSLTGIGITTEVIQVVLIMACAPAASSATMFAERYDCDAAYVSKLVAISTILSIATMPLVILLSYI